MVRKFEKTASLLLSAVFLLQFAGCSREDDPEETTASEETSLDENDPFAPEVVLDRADRFAVAVWTCDTDEFRRVCDSSYSDIEAQMEEMLDFYWVNPGTDEEAKVYQAIIDNLKYEIDEDSLDINEQREVASVDISFQLPDYETLYSDPYIQSSDDFVQEASVTFADPFVMTIEMELSGDAWKITNYREVFDRIYSFIGVEFDLERPVLDADDNGALDIELTSDHLEWWNDYGEDPCNPVFVNVERIACELPIEEEGALVNGVYATFSADGVVLATEYDSTFVTFEAIELPEDYYIREDGTFDSYIAPGEYNISFYNGDGALILSQDLKVEYHADETGYRVEFSGLYSEDDVLYANTTEITANLMEGESYIIPVGGSATVEYKGEVIAEFSDLSTGTVTLSVNEAGADADPSGRYLAEGEYTVTFYDYRGSVCASATCTVDVA